MTDTDPRPGKVEREASLPPQIESACDDFGNALAQGVRAIVIAENLGEIDKANGLQTELVDDLTDQLVRLLIACGLVE